MKTKRKSVITSLRKKKYGNSGKESTRKPETGYRKNGTKRNNGSTRNAGQRARKRGGPRGVMAT